MTTHTAISKAATPDASEALKFFENKNRFTTGPVEVSYMLKETPKPVTIVDVRAAEDFAKGRIPGALNLPRDRWDDDPQALPRDRKLVLYCYTQTCHLASKAAAKLAADGYDVMEMEGGWETWQQKGLPVEK